MNTPPLSNTFDEHTLSIHSTNTPSQCPLLTHPSTHPLNPPSLPTLSPPITPLNPLCLPTFCTHPLSLPTIRIAQVEREKADRDAAMIEMEKQSAQQFIEALQQKALGQSSPPPPAVSSQRASTTASGGGGGGGMTTSERRSALSPSNHIMEVIPPHPTPSHPIPSHPTPSHPIPPHPIPPHPIPPHPSPPPTPLL